MLFGRFSSSIGLVGVDFSTGGVKMLQVREVPNSNSLEVVGAACVDWMQQSAAHESGIEKSSSEEGAQTQPSAFESQLSEQIRNAFSAGGFTGRNCVVSLPRADVRVQSIRVPKMPNDEMKQTAGWEAAQRFGLDQASIEVDYIRTGATLSGAENREEIIIIAAPHAAIQARLGPIIEAGLRPVAVETGFSALVRAFSRQARRDADLATARVIVDIGSSGSTILILRGDQIAFCKPLSISGNMLDQAVADHLQMTMEQAHELRQTRIHAAVSLNQSNDVTNGNATLLDEPQRGRLEAADSATDRAVFAAVRPIMNELVKEITLCMRYYGVTFRGQPPQRLILTGGDALEPRLDETIASTCRMKVMFDDAPEALSGLMNQIESSLHRYAGPAPCWAAAAGLSLRGLDRRRVEKRTAPAIEPQRAAA